MHYSLWSTYKVLNLVFMFLILKSWKLLLQLKCNIVQFRILQRRTYYYSPLVKFWRGVCVFKIFPRWKKHQGENMHITGKIFLKGVCSRVWRSGRTHYELEIIFTPCPETSQGDNVSSWKHNISTMSLLTLPLDFHLAWRRHWQHRPGQTVFRFLNQAQSWKYTKVEWLLNK